MQRTKTNFIVDAVSFAGFTFLIATGVLVRYVLPPGSGHTTTLWGLDRHQWGGIHFWIAVLFLSVMAIHLFLHWRWIISVTTGQAREASGLRLALGLLGLFAVLALSLAPFWSPVERTRPTTAHRRESVAGAHEPEQIRGRMTLQEIAEATEIPVEDLRVQLGLPPSVSMDTGVAKLGKSHGFDIDGVRRIVIELQSRE